MYISISVSVESKGGRSHMNIYSIALPLVGSIEKPCINLTTSTSITFGDRINDRNIFQKEIM